MDASRFKAGDRVYHRRRQAYGTWSMPSTDPDASWVAFDGDDLAEITTSWLDHADQHPQNGDPHVPF
jgi:hypothetical protein